MLTATVDGSGEVLYTLQINIDGTYDFTLVTPDAGSIETTGLVGLSSGGPSTFLETPDGSIEFTGSGNGINSGGQGFGINNQFVGNGESFSIEFHDPGMVGDDAPLSNPQFVDSIILTNDNINGSLTITYTAFNDDTNEMETGTLTISGTETLIDPSISFNRIEIEGTGGSGQGVRFVSISTVTQVLPNDLNLDFAVTAIDGDGDASTTQEFSVNIDADDTSTLVQNSTILESFNPFSAAIFDEAAFVMNENDLNGSIQGVRDSTLFGQTAAILAGLAGIEQMDNSISYESELTQVAIETSTYEGIIYSNIETFEQTNVTFDPIKYDVSNVLEQPISTELNFVDDGVLPNETILNEAVENYEAPESFSLLLDSVVEGGEVQTASPVQQSAITGDELMIFGDEGDLAASMQTENILEGAISEIMETASIDELVNMAGDNAAENGKDESSSSYTTSTPINDVETFASTSNFDPADDIQMLQIAAMAVVS